MPADPSRSGASAPHIVFLCLVYYPDTSATSLLFTDLFERLAARGARVTVLCGFPSKDTAAEVQELPRADSHRGVRIVRCGLRLQGKRSLWTRALAYGSFLLHAGWKLLGMARRATVVGGTDPPFTPVALWALSLLGRFRYDSLLLDLYPDGFLALGTLSASSPVARLWRWLNRRSFLRARRIIVIGRDMIVRLGRSYGVTGSKIVYIPHWSTSEIDAIPVTQDRPLLDRLGLHGRFVVQYSGNMGLWHDMDTFVRAADRLREHERIHFLFVGKGRRRAGAERLSRELNLPNVTWLDFVPREELPAVLVSCDAALISMRSGLEGVAVPSKLYGILASGRAVIAQVPSLSEVALVVEEERCGVVVPPDDVDALASALAHLASDPDEVARMGQRARQAYEARYTIDHAVDAFSALWLDVAALSRR